MIDRVQAKQAAKNCMRAARISPYQIGLVYFLIVFALNSFDMTMTKNFSMEYYMDAYGLFVTVPTAMASFVSVLVMLLLAVLEAGFVTYCLGVRRGREMPLGTLFDGFSIVGKVILLNVVMWIFVFLWSMLFIIPGIIAIYRYRFALYNLLENPDIGIMEAISLSKQQTKGYKWDLFILDLSFLGWMILSLFTMGLLTIWLNPYMTLTDIAYYDTICEIKGMTASGQSGWKYGTPDDNPYQNPYQSNWEHQNSNWNDAPSQQPQTPPVLQMPEPPVAPEAPVQPESKPGADPWENKKDREPWDSAQDKSDQP